jgi:prepilin-type N-terminal cleavage/methylation domain-containing protein
MKQPRTAQSGFTLIEMSIVLVIIGLIIGGIIVGRDLIKAAEVRATITQIEKYNTAANTFYGKYGYLPGDIPAGPAAMFGLAARGQNKGQGDGNGVLEGYNTSGASNGFNQVGENIMFWVDLTTAQLIDGSFTTAVATTLGYSSPYITGAGIDSYLPAAKMGNGNYFYVFSGGWNDNEGGGGTNVQSNSLNYFGLATVTSIGSASCPPCLFGQQGMTVNQAYAMDTKIDDGLPMSGRVVSSYLTSNNWYWGSGLDHYSNMSAPTVGIIGNSTTCFDNSGVAGATEQYSLEVNGGTNVTCALTFRMQAGDQ